MNLQDVVLIRKKSILSNISISITRDKKIVVKAPFWVSLNQINKFISSKKDWIEKKLNTIKDKPEKKYEDGEVISYFGKSYSLIIRSDQDTSRTTAVFCETEIIISINPIYLLHKNKEEIQKAIKCLFYEKGVEEITQKVNQYASKIGVVYRKITLKEVSSIWGSCSRTNNLSFNKKLLSAPHEIVNYVIIHELCHMVHRNHGKDFWNLVSKFDPEFKAHRKWLRHNQNVLEI